MKRKACIAAVAFLLAGMPAQARASQWEVRDTAHILAATPGKNCFTADGEEIPLPDGMEVSRKDGYLMLPAEPLLRSLGGSVEVEEWENTGEMVWIYWREKLIGIDAKNGTARVDGAEIPLTGAVGRQGGQVSLSLRSWGAILSACGYTVESGSPSWDSQTQTAVLEFSGQELVPTGAPAPAPSGEGAVPEYILAPTRAYQRINNLGDGYFAASTADGGTDILDSAGKVRQSYGKGIDAQYLGEDRFLIVDFDDLEEGTVVDGNGEEVFSTEDFKGLGSYSEGLATLKCRNGNVGYLDIWGNLVIPAKYANPQPFSDGLALVGRQGQYIDKGGETVIDAGYDSCCPFREGLAAVRDKEGNWGYIDTAGREAIPPQYGWAGDFQDGTAFVIEGKGAESAGLYRIDKDGRKERLAGNAFFQFPSAEKRAADVIAAEEILEYAGGHAHLQTLYGKDGEIPYGKYRWARESAEGLMACQDEETGKWGYVDEAWSWAVAPVFDHAEPFSDGYAVVSIEAGEGASAWGVIKKP